MLSAWQFKRLVWKENLISQRINSFELDPVIQTINNPEEMNSGKLKEKL